MPLNSVIVVKDRLIEIERRIASRGGATSPILARTLAEEQARLRETLWAIRRDRAVGLAGRGAP